MALILLMALLMALALLSGCGTADGTLDLSDTQSAPEGPVFVRDGKDGVTVILSGDGKIVRYLGHIENNAQQPTCFVNVFFSALDAEGSPIDIGGSVQAFVNGVTLTNFQQEIDSCLKPGDFGSFDTGEQSLTGVFSDFEFKICFRENSGTEQCQFLPLAQEPMVQLELLNVTALEDNDGNRVITGQVRNNSSPDEPNNTAHNIRVHFTILSEEGMVMGTAQTPALTAQPCPEGTAPQNSCLGPNVLTETFSLNTQTPASATCATTNCFEYQIYHQLLRIQALPSE